MRKRKSKKKNFFNKIKAFFTKKRSKPVKEVEEDDDNIREVIVERNSGFNTVEVLVIVLISALFGLIAGFVLSYSRTTGTEVSEEVKEIISTYDSIVKNYYGEIDENELLDAAVSGMVNTLDDPYSFFIDSDDAESFNETVDGSFVGIGATVEWADNKFRIIEILADSPAKKANLKVDDYIIRVGDTSVDGKTLDELTELIRGKKGTKVNITVLRGEEELTIAVERDIVEIPSVSGMLIDDSIGYVEIESFASNTAEQFEVELKKLEKKKIKSLIIDVRDNPGGRLGEVDDILDLFLAKNKVLYKIETKDKIEKIYTEDATKRSYPVAVLVNYDSASASEILAASFQDNYEKATIVGTVTYGKGTIQKAVKLSSGSTVKYTTQKWLTPKGVWINEVGIMPDTLIEQSNDYCTNPGIDNDVQLQKAIEILKK